MHHWTACNTSHTAGSSYLRLYTQPKVSCELYHNDVEHLLCYHYQPWSLEFVCVPASLHGAYLLCSKPQALTSTHHTLGLPHPYWAHRPNRAAALTDTLRRRIHHSQPIAHSNAEEPTYETSKHWIAPTVFGITSLPRGLDALFHHHNTSARRNQIHAATDRDIGLCWPYPHRLDGVVYP